MFGEITKRASDGGSSSGSSSSESKSSLSETTQWVGASKASVSDEQLKRTIVEMTTLNRKRWSHEAVAAVTGGPRGTVQAVMAPLAQGPPEAHTQHEFNAIDFGDADDPLVPDWRNLEEAGVLPKLREAKVTKTQRPFVILQNMLRHLQRFLPVLMSIESLSLLLHELLVLSLLLHELRFRHASIKRCQHLLAQFLVVRDERWRNAAQHPSLVPGPDRRSGGPAIRARLGVLGRLLAATKCRGAPFLAQFCRVFSKIALRTVFYVFLAFSKV